MLIEKNYINHCSNRRLKAYLLVLASGGMRAIEALTIRECDIDFSGIDFADSTDRSNLHASILEKNILKRGLIGTHSYQMNQLVIYMNGLNGNTGTDT